MFKYSSRRVGAGLIPRPNPIWFLCNPWEPREIIAIMCCPTSSVENCAPSHLPQVLDIYNHYVHHSPATFDTESKSLSSLCETYDSIVQQGLPCLVAVLSYVHSGSAGSVIGYCYTSQLRPRPAYAASVELTIYIHPSYINQGHGKHLLSAVLQKLREVPKSSTREHGIREVLTVSAIDPCNDVRKFYAKSGFVEVGRLKKVGWKFGRWWDTSYGQLSFGEEVE